MLSILVWAFSAYAEIWIYRNIKHAFNVISNLLHSEIKYPTKAPTDYLIVQGFYKGRKAICRINRHPSSRILHYTLSLHFYIEPASQSQQDNRIYYQYTSSTSVTSYIFTNKISEYDIRNAFEELTRAAEMSEADSQGNKFIF